MLSHSVERPRRFERGTWEQKGCGGVGMRGGARRQSNPVAALVNYPKSSHGAWNAHCWAVLEFQL